MNRIILIGILLWSTHVNGQMSIGGVLDFSVKKLLPTDNAIDTYINLGLIVKKNLTTDLNIVSGISIRYFDADINKMAIGTDLKTHYRDAHPNEFYYIVPGEYFRLSYINIPLGVELKLTSFLRVQYNLENNFLIGTSDEVEEYLQYGKQSIASHMISHNMALLLHQRNAMGIGFGVTLNPAIIRDDLHYTYQFMPEFSSSFKDSILFNIILWGDFKFKQRKKVL